MKIYTDKEMSIKEALEYMDDEWIEDGNCCHQTTMDLRDCCKQLLEDINSEN